MSGNPVVQILGIGHVSQGVLLMVARHVREMFGLEASAAGTLRGNHVDEASAAAAFLPDPGYAYDGKRGQYSSTVILRRLDSYSPPGAERLLAITDVDLFIPMVTFVYGQAQLSMPQDADFGINKVAIVSLARLEQEFYGLPPDRDLTVRRIRKEVSHELGHTFGLVHCTDKSCLMCLSTEILQIDVKSENFCESCWVVLEENLRLLKKDSKKSKNVVELHK